MLPKRLQALTKYISSNDVVADIGSDHGLLPLYLVNNGHSFVFAGENKKGPYDILVRAISEAGRANEVQTSYSDGLSALPPIINTVVIAGMGGALIGDILARAGEKLDFVTKLILLPHNNEQELRKVLNFIGFKIISEEVVEDEGKFYEIIVAHNEPCAVCGVETLFGPYNLREKTPTFIAKWTNVYAENAKLLANEQLTTARRDEIIAEQAQIENAIKTEDDDEY